ncbi:MAG TPA: hypothetical protein VGN16_03515 [Acidobacteriaceae bacterium]|jgi:hypothetical protein
MFPRPPQRPAPATPPAPWVRTNATLPEDYDAVNIKEFDAEFNIIPVPDQTQAKANALVCNESNMNYIKSNLRMAPLNLQDFYTQMAKRQWQAAQPFVSRTSSPMHVAKGMLAIGARRDLGANPMLADNSRPMMPGGHATDWNLIPGLERVNAYAFRGDKRSPRSIKDAGGFQPPSTRTDKRYMELIASRFAAYMKKRFNQDVVEADVVQYIRGKGEAGRAFMEYEMWRSILKKEEMHIGRMVADEFLRGYISTSRNVNTAYSFASMTSADGKRQPIYAVYALHSDGGFLLPPSAQHVHGTKGTEAEIAHPGPLPWNKVVAFRTYLALDFNNDRTFQRTKYIFVRKELVRDDPKGAEQVIWALGSLS